MNKWEKILDDVSKSDSLSDNQRYWKSLAHLKLGQTPLAEKIFDEGSLQFKNLSRSQCLYSEILIRKGLLREAEQLLIQLWPVIQEDKTLMTSWLFACKKIKNPGTGLQKLLERSAGISTHDPLDVTLDSDKNWRQFLQLQRNRENFPIYIEYLKWSAKKGLGHRELNAIGQLLISNCKLSFVQWKELTSLFQKFSCWNFIIEHTFLPMTQLSHQKLHLWTHQHRSCPMEYRPSLVDKMKRYLEKNPNFELEQFLNQFHREN